MDYNIWSGSDYNRDINDFNKRNMISSSPEWSYIGNRSIKGTKIGEEWADYTTEYMFDLDQGNYLFSCNVYSPNASGKVFIFLEDSNTGIVEFSSSENVQSLSITINNHRIIGLRLFFGTLNNPVYLDNFSIISQ